MDSTPSGSRPSTAAAAPNSTELMIALSQIQQLIPLLDYRPGGLTHLLPTLLTPLLPVGDANNGGAGPEALQRYRANVEHAFRVAGELAGRVQDGASVGSALELAERLMKEGDDKARMLRVRKKRRLFFEQEKVLEVNNWGPPVPVRQSVASKTGAADKELIEKTTEEVKAVAFLPSQNPTNTAHTPAQQAVLPPKTPKDIQTYLAALHSFLKTAAEAGLAPQGVTMKQVKARLATFSPFAFVLEVQVASLMKAFIEATPNYAVAGEGEEGELVSVDLAGLTLGGFTEAITSTTPSAFPIFRSLSADILAQTNRALSTSASNASGVKDEKDNAVWLAYKPITEAVARIILAAAQFQA